MSEPEAEDDDRVPPISKESCSKSKDICNNKTNNEQDNNL